MNQWTLLEAAWVINLVPSFLGCNHLGSSNNSQTKSNMEGMTQTTLVFKSNVATWLPLIEPKSPLGKLPLDFTHFVAQTHHKQ